MICIFASEGICKDDSENMKVNRPPGNIGKIKTEPPQFIFAKRKHEKATFAEKFLNHILEVFKYRHKLGGKPYQGRSTKLNMSVYVYRLGKVIYQSSITLTYTLTSQNGPSTS